MNNSGKFLDPFSTTLPLSPLTIALVYNIKEEAHNQSSGSAHHQLIPADVEPSASLSPREISLTADASLRANDVYAEWDTIDTITAVKNALEERHSVVMVEANTSAYQRLAETRPDFVFNIAEGLHGASREAQMPAIFEMLGLPYLGSDPLTLSVCLDKSRAKEILGYHGIPTAPFAVVDAMDEFEDVRVRFPSIVKPLHEGSSKGIYNSCVVKNAEELEHEVRTVLEVYKQPALIEEFLTGREFTVAILGNGRKLRVLPIVEIKFDALPRDMNAIYSYEAKWVLDRSDNPLEIFECPAHLDMELQEHIERICTDAYRIFRCRDWSRIDVRLDSRGVPNILEINPLPGILPKPEDNSCFPKSARAAGMSYNQLINNVLDIALARAGVVSPKTKQNAAEIK